MDPEVISSPCEAPCPAQVCVHVRVGPSLGGSLRGGARFGRNPFGRNRLGRKIVPAGVVSAGLGQLRQGACVGAPERGRSFFGTAWRRMAWRTRQMTNSGRAWTLAGPGLSRLDPNAIGGKKVAIRACLVENKSRDPDALGEKEKPGSRRAW